MTTTEHLQLIKDECERLLAEYDAMEEMGMTRYHIEKCAEAGWRATMAAIDGLLKFYTLPNVEAPNEMYQVWQHDAEIAEESLNLILAAWPLELLTNKQP
jgi:hypothetical protein